MLWLLRLELPSLRRWREDDSRREGCLLGRSSLTLLRELPLIMDSDLMLALRLLGGMSPRVLLLRLLLRPMLLSLFMREFFLLLSVIRFLEDPRLVEEGSLLGRSS